MRCLKVSKTAAKKPVTPLSAYTKAKGDEICERIATGETLRDICRSAHMPNFQRVYEWIDADEDFAGRIARARDIGFDAIAFEALKIADTPIEGVETTTKDDGRVEKKTGDMLGHRKLQVETRLKLLAKWSPKKYGEKIAQEITGANGGPVVIAGAPTDADL